MEEPNPSHVLSRILLLLIGFVNNLICDCAKCCISTVN